MEAVQNSAITLNFTDGQTVHIDGEFWTKKGLDKFDVVRAEKIKGYGIVLYGEFLSEEDKAKLPAKKVVEAKTSFDVLLTSFGATKLDVVREVKEITSLGLRESMALVTELGKVKEGVSSEEAEAIKVRLEAKGATIELK